MRQPSDIAPLCARGDFVEAYKKGRRYVATGMIVQMHPRARQQNIGLGLTASKKLGGAVVRNRVRRRLRALALAELPALGRAAHNYVLVGRRTTARRAFADLRDDFTAALAHLHAPRKKSKKR